MKIKVMGNAAVYTSTAKVSDIEKLQKYNPDALTLKNADGDEIFRLGYGTIGGVNRHGIVFDSVSRDGEGYATLTMAAPDGENIAELLADELSGIDSMITTIEAMIEDAVAEVDTQRNALMRKIEIVG